VKPGGTGRPRLLISARFAPLPPRRLRSLAAPSALPSPNVYTHFAIMASLDAGRLIKDLQQLQALLEPAPVAYAISNTAANQKSAAATIESIRLQPGNKFPDLRERARSTKLRSGR